MFNKIKNKYYILFSISLGKLVFGFYLVSISSIMVLIGDTFDINIKTQSLVFPFNSIGQFFICFFIGYISDKFSIKIVNIISLILVCLICVAFIYANTYYFFSELA